MGFIGWKWSGYCGYNGYLVLGFGTLYWGYFVSCVFYNSHADFCNFNFFGISYVLLYLIYTIYLSIKKYIKIELYLQTYILLLKI